MVLLLGLMANRMVAMVVIGLVWSLLNMSKCEATDRQISLTLTNNRTQLWSDLMDLSSTTDRVLFNFTLNFRSEFAVFFLNSSKVELSLILNSGASAALPRSFAPVDKTQQGYRLLVVKTSLLNANYCVDTPSVDSVCTLCLAATATGNGVGGTMLTLFGGSGPTLKFGVVVSGTVAVQGTRLYGIEVARSQTPFQILVTPKQGSEYKEMDVDLMGWNEPTALIPGLNFHPNRKYPDHPDNLAEESIVDSSYDEWYAGLYVYATYGYPTGNLFREYDYTIVANAGGELIVCSYASCLTRTMQLTLVDLLSLLFLELLVPWRFWSFVC